MKNLILEEDLGALLPLEEDGHAVKCCLNSTEPRLYIATSHCDVLCLSLETLKVEWQQSINAVAGGPDSVVTGFCFSLELEAICISLSTGELLLLNVDTQQLEEVGAVEGGIVALQWSPDGEVLAVISGMGNILLMDQEWELLAEVHLADPPPGCPNPGSWFRDVQLSWRGDGKFFATSHQALKDGALQRVMHVWDRTASCQLHATCEEAQGLLPVLAWQPNGRHLYTVQQQTAAAQSSKPPGSAGLAAKRAALRAGAQPPQQLAGPEGVKGGGTAPAGLHQQHQQQQQQQTPAPPKLLPPPPRVLLYERNGLGHGGFPLRARGRVVAMEWSSDSELLAVLQAVEGQRCAVDSQQQQPQQPSQQPQQESRSTSAHQEHSQQQGGGQREWQLQIWHRSNWHWYLKLERRYSVQQQQPDESVECSSTWGVPPLLLWDDKQASRLHVVVPRGRGMQCGAAYEQMQVLWDACVSDRGTAVVVDGRQLLITPLRHSVVPPPMSAARAVLPSSVAALAVSSSTQGPDEAVAVAMSDGRLALLRSCEEDLWEETLEEELDARAAAAHAQPAHSPPHPQGADDDVLVGCGDAYVGSSSEDALQPMLAHAEHWPLQGKPRVRALCWLGDDRLLAVQAAWSAQGETGGGAREEQQQGLGSRAGHGGGVGVGIRGDSSSGGSGYGGDVLVELQVLWPCSDSLDVQGGQQDQQQQQQSQPGVRVRVAAAPVCTSPGTRVLQVVPHAASGAVVAMATGEVRHYIPSSSSSSSPSHPGGNARLLSLGQACSFPAACPWVVPVPPLEHLGQASASLSPALGLSRAGHLYWGAMLVASEVTSLTTRTGGAGGPALLFCSRRSLMYTVFLAQLGVPGGYAHKELTEASGLGLPSNREQLEVSEYRFAVSQGMRPNAATAAARDVLVRSVEQGSHLLAAPKDGVRLVMQMPRGNLEAVAPRMLVLAAIVDALQAWAYAVAWELATTNRVDLNLLVDWNWPAFLYDVPAFVAAVPAPSDLTDLLFALRPGNMCDEGGLYAGIPIKPSPASPQGQQYAAAAAGAPNAEGGEPFTQQAEGSLEGCLSREQVEQALRGGKVNAVCMAMRAAVEARMKRHAAGGSAAAEGPHVAADGVSTALPGSTHAAAQQLLTVLVTTFSRSQPPQLGQALSVIKDAKEASLAKNSASGQQGPAEQALRAMLLHVDADAAYQAALGLYELPLAFMVITHAQRDPGEYALELQRFAEVQDPHMRRYAIDMHLKRFSLALGHLVAADRDAHFEQALALAKQHNLLRQLLALYHEDPVRRRMVLRACGEALEASNKMEDAGVAYVAAGALQDGLRAYRAAGQWRQVFVLAGRLNYDAKATTRLAAEFADELASNAQPAAAAAVLLHYLGDVDNGVATLASAREWHEALRTAYAAQRVDLVHTVIAPAAAEAAANLLGDARDARDKIAKYLARLQEVRRKRVNMDEALRAAAEGEDGIGPSYEEMADAASETGASILTGMSIYTDTSRVGGPGGSSVSGGSGAPSSSRAPSTLGGRKAQRAADKKATAKARKGRVKQGSPEEEASLVVHVMSLAPPEATLTHTGALAELLVILDHEEDARTLQAAVSEWIAAHQDAAEDIYQNPFPEDRVPHAYHQILELQRRPGKPAPEVAWKWDILRAAT